MKTTLQIVWPFATLLLLLLSSGCDQGKRPGSDFTPDGTLQIQVNLSTNRITLGETTQLSVDIYHPLDSTIQELPVQTREKAIDVSNREWETAPYNESILHTQVDYELSSWQLGQHLVATGEVACVLADGTTETIPLPEKMLEVVTVLETSGAVPEDWPASMALTNSTNVVTLAAELPREPMSDIKPNDQLKEPSKLKLLWLFLGIALLAIIIATITALLIKPKAKAAKAPPPPPPAHETALQALDQLMADKLVEKGEHEPFYVRLSLIVREYIEARFHLQAPEMTTEEFIRETAYSSRLIDEHKVLAAAFLEQSDLVKFAQFKPDATQMNTAHDSARRLVVETQPREEPT